MGADNQKKYTMHPGAFDASSRAKTDIITDVMRP
jgi:hypothetical protein